MYFSWRYLKLSIVLLLIYGRISYRDFVKKIYAGDCIHREMHGNELY